MITSENAAAMAKKGNDARRAQLEELRVALSVLSGDSGKEYRARRVARVRRQLDRIDSMMMEEIDPQKLDRLASAQARLSEQERVLSGTPLPGSLRPAQERTARGTPAATAPVPADPTGAATPQQDVSPVEPSAPQAEPGDIVGIQ